MKILRNIRQAAAATVRILTVALLAVNLAAMLWIVLALEHPKEMELLAVLVIAMGTVVAASFITTVLHRWISPADDETPPGDVFRESIKRYAWFAAPIASGYGIAQIVARIAEVVAQAQ